MLDHFPRVIKCGLNQFYNPKPITKFQLIYIRKEEKLEIGCWTIESNLFKKTCSLKKKFLVFYREYSSVISSLLSMEKDKLYYPPQTTQRSSRPPLSHRRCLSERGHLIPRHILVNYRNVLTTIRAEHTCIL